MSLLKRLRSVLGLNGSDTGEVEEPGAITVERTPGAEPEESTAGVETETTVEPEPTFEHDGSVTEITGIGAKYAERLSDAGIETVGGLAAADAATLASETDIGEGRISTWIEDARELAERE